jgi:hypothetical protein
MSVVEPGAKATMTFTIRDGYGASSARAADPLVTLPIAHTANSEAANSNAVREIAARAAIAESPGTLFHRQRADFIAAKVTVVRGASSRMPES